METDQWNRLRTHRNKFTELQITPDFDSEGKGIGGKGNLFHKECWEGFHLWKNETTCPSPILSKNQYYRRKALMLVVVSETAETVRCGPRQGPSEENPCNLGVSKN